MQWWQERAPRERGLILVAGGLLTCLLVFQFMYRPLVDYRERGERAYLHALDTLQAVQQGAAKAESLKGVAVQQAKRSNEPVRTTVTRTAFSARVKVSRMQPDADGLTVWIDEAEAAALQKWVSTLQSEHGITVKRATIAGLEDRPLVRAQIQFTSGGGA